MKKTAVLLAVCLLLQSFLFASCSRTPKPDAENTAYGLSDAESKTQLKNTTEEVLGYFNRMINEAKAARPALTYKTEINIPDTSVCINARGADFSAQPDPAYAAPNAAAHTIRALVLKNLDNGGGSVLRGGDNTGIMPVSGEPWASSLTADDVAYASVKEIGSRYEVTVAFRDLADDEAVRVLSKAFDMKDKNALIESGEFEKAAPYLALDGLSLVYRGCIIRASINRLTDELIGVEYIKNIAVTADVTGCDSLADYGEMTLYFTLEKNLHLEFSF